MWFSLATIALADRAFNGLGCHVGRRQLSECPNLCASIGSALTSCTNDECFCPTALSVGPACSSCIASYNATLASALGSVLTTCLSLFPILSTGSTVPVPSSGCAQQCDPISTATEICTDFSCFCPTVLQYGPICSACWATVNVLEASDIEYLITECRNPATDTFPTPSQTSMAPTITSHLTAASSFTPGTIASHSGTSGGSWWRWERNLLQWFFFFLISASVCIILFT
jgi:hypothetical protein